jgi:hypothetical protein
LARGAGAGDRQAQGIGYTIRLPVNTKLISRPPHSEQTSRSCQSISRTSVFATVPSVIAAPRRNPTADKEFHRDFQTAA